MKKFMKAIAAIMLMTAVLFAAGCKPEDEPNNGGGNGTYNGHEYVDLGLPSGTLWATCNVGSDTPEGYGDHFAWGETMPKTTYNWSTYKYSNGDSKELTKYCNNSFFGYEDFADTLTTLLPEDDAATAQWGSGWCTPTADQLRELYTNTSQNMTTQNGVYGCLFTASNGNSIFMPTAGRYWDDEHSFDGSYGFYWASSLDTNYPCNAISIGFTQEGEDSRCSGQSVRPVRSLQD